MSEEEVISWFKNDKGRDPSKAELKHIRHYLEEGDLKTLESFCGFPNSNDQEETTLYTDSSSSNTDDPED